MKSSSTFSHRNFFPELYSSKEDDKTSGVKKRMWDLPWSVQQDMDRVTDLQKTCPPSWFQRTIKNVSVYQSHERPQMSSRTSQIIVFRIGAKRLSNYEHIHSREHTTSDRNI
jgi:hypothetical protein